MKKKVFSILVLVSTLCMVTPALAAKKNNDATSSIATIGIVIFVAVMAIILWACHTPSSVKDYQRKEKAKQQERQNTVSDAATSRLGVVILRYELGHYQTSYFEGVGSSTYFVNGGGPDSAGGYTAIIEVVNSCGKTAKYFKFHTRLLNYVGDPAPCEIGKPDNILEATGPLSHGSTYAWEWKNFVYSRNVGKMVLDSVTVDYMDGTSEEFSGDQIVWRLSKIN